MDPDSYPPPSQHDNGGQLQPVGLPDLNGWFHIQLPSGRSSETFYNKNHPDDTIIWTLVASLGDGLWTTTDPPPMPSCLCANLDLLLGHSSPAAVHFQGQSKGQGF